MYVILFLFLNFIEYFIIYKLTKICINKPAKNRKIEILSYIILYLVNCINYLVINIPDIIFIGNVLGIFFIIYNYKISFLLKIAHPTFILCILCLPELLLIKFCLVELKDSFEKNGYVDLWVILFIQTLLCFVYFIIKTIMYFKNRKLIINLYMMIIIILGLLFNVFILFEDAKNPSSLALSSILVLCIIPSTIYTYIKLIEYNDERLRISIIEKQNKYYEQQLLTINNLNKASKSVKHDYKNHISIIKSLIDNEEFEKLKDYTYDICSKIDNIEKMYFTENIIINSILTFKVDNIKENNINYNFNIKIPKDLKISHVDITIIISNLLDNAIEACIRDLKTINKHINFSLQLKNNLLIIKCNNTFDGILKKTSKGIISRKMNDINIDCGIGLFNIENIVKKYDGIMELKYDKQIFNVEITLII